MHLSDSSEQRRAEPLILEQISAHVGKVLAKRIVTSPGGARVEIDGVAEADSVFAEVFAHLGALKGGQRHRPAVDALKLITLARRYPKVRLIVAFADAPAVRYLTGTGWRARGDAHMERGDARRFGPRRHPRRATATNDGQQPRRRVGAGFQMITRRGLAFEFRSPFTDRDVRHGASSARCP